MITGLLIVAALLCAAVAAVLSTAEAGLIRLSRREAEDIAERQGSGAVQMLLQEPVPHTVALQLWRWLFATAAVVQITVGVQLAVDDVALAALTAGAVLVVGGVGLATVSPRRLGRAHHLMVSAATARLVRGLRLVLGPIPVMLAGIGARIAPGPGEAYQGFFDDEEFREFVARASETDILEDTEAELIQSVFDLSATRVRSVMVPRTDMVTVDTGASLPEVMTLFLRSGYSRVPVVRGSADDITGMVYLKDVAYLEHQLRTGEAAAEYRGRAAEAITVDEVQRDVRYVPESKSVSEFLSELQRESTHVAVVVDEYGGTAGLVTLEDLIEEIVGEIVDEYDVEAVEVEDLPDGRRRLSARMAVDDFADLYDLDLDDEEEVDTLGGLLAKTLGRVPIAGSEVEIEGVVLRADRLEGRRNRVSHVLAWEVEGRRGARAGLGTDDAPEALAEQTADGGEAEDLEATAESAHARQGQ
ncbi:hemolysin family protein [Nesterenkonia xinjiangensis]|uniref:CBS domain containing-hemolysin-like protein n=1 Tax=Nesterenkonia xinjiangensis TaxID=225327 RepID=A0A7Z0GNV5_9MICC|nr:CBS domain-containing protein [Nesterenkonia xinjiangensis]NYJ79439.1 CBS domain containing-hemolysin-like protein [Nesterenkonia xinjiangensis]